MSHFTDFGETLICNVIKGGQPSLPSVLHLALLTAVDENSYTEVSWSGYARQALPRDLLTWSGTQGAGSIGLSNGSSHVTSNNIAIDFGTVGTTTTVVAFGLFAGNDMVAYSLAVAPIYLEPNDTYSVPIGKLQFDLGSTGGGTDYLSNKLIDWLWRGQDYNYPATMWLALFKSLPTNSGGGTEVAGIAYERVSQPAGNWGAPNDGTILNSTALTFSVPQSDWGTVVGSGFYDSKNGGNLLWWAPVNMEKTIVNGGAAPTFDAGTVAITVL